MGEAIIRCKLKITDILCGKNENGVVTTEIIKLKAVYAADENKKWSKWTPQADMTIHISNPEEHGKLRIGNEFYVDIIPAESLTI